MKNVPAITHTEPRIAVAAERLWRARRECAPIEVLTAHWPELDEAGAYAVARATLALASERPAGYKLGYTSAAMRAQMGVEQPNYGVLTEAGRIEADGEVALAGLIHPLVEPEIALVLARDLHMPVGDADALHGAVASVHPALEIVDTRYREYRFSACDNIADNSSAAHYVLGLGVAPAALPDLATLGVTLIADGMTLERGSGADALGHPLRALAWLANRLIAEGTLLRAGAVVLSGGLTRAHAARAGMSFKGGFSELGEVRIRFI